MQGKYSKLFKLFNNALYIVSAAMLITGAFLTVATSPANADAGAIWTTTNSCGSPQNANHYRVGDVVYINYANLSHNLTLVWSIDKTNNPKRHVIGGTHNTGNTGAGCWPAYTILQADYPGEYDVMYAAKHDNYNVVLAPTATNTPRTPTVTNTPVTPTITNTPVTPTITNTPVTPTITNTPVTPTITDTPVTPTITDTPETPTITDTPETPTITNTPQTPTVTDTPETPTITNTPETPTATVEDTFTPTPTIPGGQTPNAPTDTPEKPKKLDPPTLGLAPDCNGNGELVWTVYNPNNVGFPYSYYTFDGGGHLGGGSIAPGKHILTTSALGTHTIALYWGEGEHTSITSGKDVCPLIIPVTGGEVLIPVTGADNTGALANFFLFGSLAFAGFGFILSSLRRLFRM